MKERKCPRCGSTELTRTQKQTVVNGKPGMYWIVACDCCGRTLETSEAIK